MKPTYSWLRPWLLLAALLLAGCATTSSKPDLARLYEDMSHQPDQPPIILIHGLMGSTLVDADTGEQFWPGGVGTLAFSDYSQLSRLDAGGEGQRRLVPGELFTGIAGVDFYGALVRSLEEIGRFRRAEPGQPVAGDGRRYYVMLYDWRRDNLFAVRQLHSLIERIRADYGDPALRVDIVAHSNGGLIANYYLRYGPADLAAEGEAMTPWNEGARRVRRLVLLGTPSLGSVTSLGRLVNGMRVGLGVVPQEVLATFATPFEALPHPLVRAVVDPSGRALDINLYDPETWRLNRWAVFSPEVVARLRKGAASPEAGERVVNEVQSTFLRNLLRAERFQWSLTAPFDHAGIDMAVFGGDCTLTPGRVVLEPGEGGARLAFRAAEVQNKVAGVDYERLLLEPGDGLITRASQVARETPDPARPRSGANFHPQAQTFFLCESHGQLTGNPYFQNNLLYFLLSR